jgi:hypothetical protein
MPEPDRRLTSCLIGLIVGLLLVGFVSGTPLRHVVQVLPASLALFLLRRRPSWSPYAALPIFLFWFLIMGLIWLHLLGLAHIITGNFSHVEIILTIFIAIWSLAGLLSFFRSSSSATLAARILAFSIFLALQIAALWLSMQPYISRR